MDIMANLCTQNALLCWRSQLKCFLNWDPQLKRQFAYKITWIQSLICLICCWLCYILINFQTNTSYCLSAKPSKVQDNICLPTGNSCESGIALHCYDEIAGCSWRDLPSYVLIWKSSPKFGRWGVNCWIWDSNQTNWQSWREYWG